MARNRRCGGGLFPGVLLIAVGIIFLLGRTDLISMPQVWRFWPLFVIWIGLVQLFKPDGGRRSIFLLLIGIWLQISTLELFGLGFSDSWPLAIIAVGGSFVFESLLRGSSGPSAHKVIIEVDTGRRADAGTGDAAAVDVDAGVEGDAERETTDEP